MSSPETNQRPTPGARVVGARERVAARQQQAMRLRVCGATFAAIAKQTGTSKMQAYRDCAAALRETLTLRDEDAATLRAIELERLDALTLALWPKAQAGDCEAARTIVRVSERRCRLLGLDAETSHKLTVAGNTTTHHVVEQRPFGALSDEELKRRWAQLAELVVAGQQVPVSPIGSALDGSSTLDAATPAPEPQPPTLEEQYAMELAARANGTRH